MQMSSIVVLWPPWSNVAMVPYFLSVASVLPLLLNSQRLFGDSLCTYDGRGVDLYMLSLLWTVRAPGRHFMLPLPS